jgi:hypothetical protein
MDRRSAIRNLTFLAGGVFLFPSCLKHEDGAVSIKLNKMSINAAQEKTVGAVTETIIPETSTPGAKTLNVHQFVLKMLDDCRGKKEQETFIKGLEQLDDLSQKQYNKDFADGDTRQRETVLMLIEKKQQIKPELADFYQMTKQLTVEGYTISKYVMTNKLPYELVPGRYSGYFPVKNLKTSVKNG